MKNLKEYKLLSQYKPGEIFYTEFRIDSTKLLLKPKQIQYEGDVIAYSFEFKYADGNLVNYVNDIAEKSPIADGDKYSSWKAWFNAVGDWTRANCKKEDLL